MKSVYTLIFLFSLGFIFLPTSVSAQREAGAYYDVVVSTRTLERGHIISRGDVELISANKNDPRAVAELDTVIGMALKRTIGRNTAIKRDYLVGASSKVRGLSRGGVVVIIVERDGLRVSAEGRLRENAKIGDIVRIENLSSGKIVFGRLIDENTAVVNF